MVNTADMFSGAGFMSEGAELGGATIIWAGDHWPEAVEVHRLRHPGAVHVCQDLQQFDFTALPHKLKLLLASPACQGSSPNGRPARKGTGGNGTVDRARIERKHMRDRATAWAVISAVEARYPPKVIVENVPDFAARWALFPQWLACLEALGYHVVVNVVDSADYGVAQDRSRAVITASLDGPIPIEPDKGHAAPWATIGEALEPAGTVEWTPVAQKRPNVQKLIAKAKSDTGRRQCFVNNVGAGVRGRTWDDRACTVTTKSIGQFYIVDGDRCRLPTIREMARLQGAPDNFQLPAGREVAGKLIGNGVPVPVAASVTEQVLAA